MSVLADFGNPATANVSDQVKAMIGASSEGKPVVLPCDKG
jgi:hypothetical protein